jgi:hypothetical protein
MRARPLLNFSAAALLLLTQDILGQEPKPPQPAAPTAQEVQDIELNTALMETTFMIQGPSIQPGGTNIGTVFIVGRPVQGTNPQLVRPTLVTAAHVLREIQGDTAILQLRRRTNVATNSWTVRPYPFKIRLNGQPLWKENPNADVAVMYIEFPTDVSMNVVTPLMFADDEMLTTYGVTPGTELRCLGYPLGNASNEALFPILRSGRISSYPLLPTETTRTFLLDFRVFKGNSGGPVYFVERMRPNPKGIGMYMNFHFIMGLVSEEKLYSEITSGPYSQEVRQTQLGLAVIVHASIIKQTIEMLPTPIATGPQ